MRIPTLAWPSLAASLLLLAACGGEPSPSAPSGGGPPASPPASAPASHLLAADVPEAVGVLAAKDAAREAPSEVAVYGRVQETAKGVFTLVDAEAVHYCGEEEDLMDDCETPWDYCCESTDKVRRSTLVVEALDAQGQPVPREELGVRPLDLVAVRGVIRKDEGGAVALEARSGWFRRERPEVGDHVTFP